MPTHRLMAWGITVSASPGDMEFGFLAMVHAMRDTIDARLAGWVCWRFRGAATTVTRAPTVTLITFEIKDSAM